jgi:hypothetical protein
LLRPLSAVYTRVLIAVHSAAKTPPATRNRREHFRRRRHERCLLISREPEHGHRIFNGGEALSSRTKIWIAQAAQFFGSRHGQCDAAKIVSYHQVIVAPLVALALPVRSASSAARHQWRAVALAVACSVKLLAGVRDRDGRLSLLLETPVGNAPKHRVRFQAEGISLIDERWADERLLRLAVTLERADLLDIFEILAVDLVSVAQGAAAPEAAVREVIRRLEAWQACLRARQRGLTKEEQAGLLGELAVIELGATQGGGPSAVSCWRGPLDGIHDFEGAGVAVEVKLMRAGYLHTDQGLYGFTRTMLGDLHAYAVREGFPRLTGALVPTAIVDAAYAIDERQLTSFRLPQDEFLAALRQMGGARE